MKSVLKSDSFASRRERISYLIGIVDGMKLYADHKEPEALHEALEKYRVEIDKLNKQLESK